MESEHKKELHVIPSSVREDSGCSRRVIARQIAQGALTQLGRGWYGTPETPENVARALKIGARLTCVDALELHGIWVVRDEKLHVATLRGEKPRTSDRDVVPHKYQHRWPDFEPIMPIRIALDHLARCRGAEDAAIALESAANQGLLSADDIDEVLAGLPVKLRGSIGIIDPRAQSGTETRVRRYLQRLGVRVEPQWFVDGVGSTDIRVGERLIIECDSARYHTDPEAYAEDRRRDQLLIALGYVVLRLTWEDVMEEWERTRELLKSIVDHRLHRKRRSLR